MAALPLDGDLKKIRIDVPVMADLDGDNVVLKADSTAFAPDTLKLFGAVIGKKTSDIYNNASNPTAGFKAGLITGGSSLKGGKSKRNRKSKGRKSRKARKSLRRK
jgi:hypothetical protein